MRSRSLERVSSCSLSSVRAWSMNPCSSACKELRPTPRPRKPPLWEREDFKIAMQDAAERMLREVREERQKRREARPLEEELPEPRPRRELRQLPPMPEPPRPPARRDPKKKAPA